MTKKILSTAKQFARSKKSARKMVRGYEKMDKTRKRDHQRNK